MSDSARAEPDTPADPPDPDCPGPTREECNLAVLTHLLGTFTFVVGALVVFLVKRDSEYITDQAREALNFQLTMLLPQLMGCFLTWPCCSYLLVPVVMIPNFVLCVIAAVAANSGQRYRYPVAIRLIS